MYHTSSRTVVRWFTTPVRHLQLCPRAERLSVDCPRCRGTTLEKIVFHKRTDGCVALTYEAIAGRYRLYDEDFEEGDKPVYVASGGIERLSDKVCKLSGLHGVLSRRHMILMTKHMLELGYTILYAERAGGHRIPGGVEITEGDFAGFARVDLVEFMARNTRWS